MPTLTELVMYSWPLRDWKEIPKEASCVYKILHEDYPDFYIGRTNNLGRRAAEHYKKLVKGKHQNPRMQNVHNKYGDKWKITVVFEGTVDDCTLKEQEILDKTDLMHSLNCHLSSTGGRLGNKMSKVKVFSMLNWAVANSKTREEAIREFHCSWDSLKKYLPEWEQCYGTLLLPLRASGEKSGNYKHGLSSELRRKKTSDEIAELNARRAECMYGANNPMFGKTHSEEARLKISQAATENAQLRRDSGFVVSQETREKISQGLKGKAKPEGDGRRKALNTLGGKAYSTPFGVFYTSKEGEGACGVKAATIMWRCKNNYKDEWSYIEIEEGTACISTQ